MPQRIIGIDVGSYSVKIAEVIRNFRSFEFVGFHERRIQYNELLSPEESISIALQGLIDDQHLTWDSAICGFPVQRVSSRLLSFPFGSRKKISQAIQLEVESQIPFDVTEVITDYSIIWSTKEASRVLGVYVRKKDFVKYLNMLTSVGIDPRSVSVEAVELINLVNLGMVPPENAYAVIDIGHEKTAVSICHGKEVGYVRAISLAGKSMTQAIAAHLGVPLDEAERLKIEMGHLSPDEGEDMDEITKGVVEAIGKVAEELVLHLRQTFFTYRDTEGGAVEGLYLSGGASRLPGLDRYLSDRLKQNVTYLNCMEFHFSRLDRADAHRHVVPQALALALKGVAPGGAPNINLRQGEFAFKGDVEQLGGSMRYVAITVAIMVSLALTYFSVSYYFLKSKLEKIESDVKEIVRQALPDVPSKAFATSKGALSTLQSKEAELKDRKEKLGAAMGTSPLDILLEISSRSPPRKELMLDVDKLSIISDRVLMSGSTDSFEAVDRLKKSLEASSLFHTVTSGNVRKGTKGEVKFDLSLDIPKEAKGT